MKQAANLRFFEKLGKERRKKNCETNWARLQHGEVFLVEECNLREYVGRVLIGSLLVYLFSLHAIHFVLEFHEVVIYPFNNLG